MEGILAFLFNNIFIVIIVIAFLSSLFSRRGRTGGNRMPDFGGGPGGLRRPGRPQAPGAPDRPGEMRSQPEAPRRPDVARYPEVARYPDHSPQPVRADDRDGRAAFPRELLSDTHGRNSRVDLRPIRMDDAVPGDSPAAPRQASPAASSAPDLTAARADDISRIAPALQVERGGRGSGNPIAGQDELRKAILWAEILGPPRALKPHGRRRFGR